jgi:hypothetical protein
MRGEPRDLPILFSTPMILALLREAREPGTGKSRRKVYSRGHETDPLHLARRLANGLDDAKDGECWEWRRHRNNHGYGKLTINGRGYYAHRLAYQLSKGAIPTGLDVMHSCDNPACINPAHLSVGSRSKNMADCHARGRSRIPSPRMRGERNGCAKLTALQVLEIRERIAAGEVQRTIAADFGVSQSAIGHIKLGKSWNG